MTAIDTTRLVQIMDIDDCSVTFDRHAEVGIVRYPDGRPHELPGYGVKYLVEMPRAMLDDLLKWKFIEQVGEPDANGRVTYRLTQTGKEQARKP